ncbi:replication initiation factor [Inoviridae sp.]|nr:replication initiation factor [Inoviridae sp.]
MAGKKSNLGTSTEDLNAMLAAGRWTLEQQAAYEKKQGITYQNYLDSPDALTDYLDGEQSHLVMQIFSDGGKVKFQQNRVKSKQDICIIDWVNVTVNEESFNLENVVTDEELIFCASRIVKSIFGFGITLQRPNGLYLYDRAYELGDNYGHLCHGGQNRTVLISIDGKGCAQASEGWQTRLYRFLELSIQPKITRIDLAHDIFDAPRFTIDHYVALFHKGKFQNGGRPPKTSQAGQWLTPDSDGRTFYVGKRANGLFTRIYEKGLQLESLEKPTWLRIELEFKSVDRILPLEMLLRPHEYFAGAYPALRSFNNQFQRVDTISHEVRADFEHRLKWAKRQSGGFLKLLGELDYTPQQIFEMLEGKEIPKAFRQKFLDNPKPSICEIPAAQVAYPTMSDINLKD